MQQYKNHILTQDDLVAALQNRGYQNIKSRDIATWRKHKLLPEFDARGAGRGRAAGREKSGWTAGDAILKQAIWICELKKIYATCDEFHLPIWILGGEVPLDDVWDALIAPLEEIEQWFAEEVETRKIRETLEGAIDRTDGSIEDIIQDLVSDLDIDLGGIPVPQEVIETIVNVCFNSGYNLNDDPFEEGAKIYLQVQNDYNQEFVKIQGYQSSTTPLEHAPFIKQHLNLTRLLDALDNCTDAELLTVQGDLKHLREIISVVGRIMEDALGKEFKKKTLTHFLPALLAVGRLFVLADLSLRRDGYGPWFDANLPTLSAQIQDAYDKKIAEELRAAEPQIRAAKRKAIKQFSFGVKGKSQIGKLTNNV